MEGVVLGGDETINATVINNSSSTDKKLCATHKYFAAHVNPVASFCATRTHRRERQVLAKYLIYKLDNKRHLCIVCMNFGRRSANARRKRDRYREREKENKRIL